MNAFIIAGLACAAISFIADRLLYRLERRRYEHLRRRARRARRNTFAQQYPHLADWRE